MWAGWTILDHVAAREAFRTQLQTLVVATTGSTTLTATTTGFTRASGSFIDDGFAAGMEIVPAGFTNNAVAIIENVIDDTHIKIVGTRSAQASGSGRSLTVGLPQNKQWQGTQTSYADVPAATRPYIYEQWVPGAVEDFGAIIDSGFYVVTWNGLANKGVKAMFTQMQALRDLFPPGWSAEVNGDLVRVTGRPAPQFTQPITLENGYEVSTLRVPWRVATTNLDPA